MPTFVDIDQIPWATAADLLQFDKELATSQSPPPDEDMLTEWLAICTDSLYTMSGRQFTGPLSAVLRPSGNCMAPATCGCKETSDVDLGELWPVIGVERVLIDGVEIDPSQYAVVRNHKLRYLTTGAPDYTSQYWPRCQYLDRPSDAPGTFEVTMTYGFPVPRLAKKATCALAAQFVRHELDMEDNLPLRAKSVSRPGFSIDVVSPEDLINNDGKTGIYVVDFFLSTTNPKKLQSPAFVFSADRQPDRNRPVLYPSQYDGRTPLTWPFSTGLYWY